MTERHVYKGVTDPDLKEYTEPDLTGPITFSPHKARTPRTKGFNMGHRRGQVAAVEELQRRLPDEGWQSLVIADYLDELHLQFNPANQETWSNHS